LAIWPDHRTVTSPVTGYRGVRRIKRRPGPDLYRAVTRINGKRVCIGNPFPTAELAARAYDKKVRELHGDSAKLNFP
jgi:hypothetical protein